MEAQQINLMSISMSLIQVQLGRECLKKFFCGVVEAFRDTYLQKGTAADVQPLMNLHDMTLGFLGTQGSID